MQFYSKIGKNILNPGKNAIHFLPGFSVTLKQEI